MQTFLLTFCSLALAHSLLAQQTLPASADEPENVWTCEGATTDPAYSSDPIPIPDDPCILQLADASSRANLPLIDIRVNFHFMEGQFAPGSSPSATSFANSQVTAMNNRLTNLQPAAADANGDPLHDAILGDSRMRVSLVTNSISVPEEVTEGVFYWNTLSDYNNFRNNNPDPTIFHIVVQTRTAGNATAYTFWNARQMFLVNAQANQNFLWGGIMLHEFGHATANLGHAQESVAMCGSVRSCDGIDMDALAMCGNGTGPTSGGCGNSRGCNYSANNNIVSSNGSLSSLSPCQWSRWYSRAIQRTYTETTCAKGSTDLVMAPGTTTWSTSRFISQDVIIPAGSKLVIECTAYFVKDVVVSVERGGELELNGGTMTRLCPNERWQGIIVAGNQAYAQPNPTSSPTSFQAGVVRIDGGTIHGAHVGIFTSRWNASTNSNEDWNDAYRGGLIIAEDANFVDNRKAVAFMKYTKPNKSTFTGCTFQESGDIIAGSEGVTVWACEGITFVNNTFADIDGSGIFGDAYAITATQNTFDNCEYGVRSVADNPYSGGFIITDNTFTDMFYYAVLLGGSGSGSDASRVEDNSSTGPQSSYGVIGTSRTTITQNYGSGTGYGARLISSGSQFANELTCNRLENFYSGIYAQGDNSGMAYTNNDINVTTYGVRYTNYNAEDGVLPSQNVPHNCYTSISGAYDLYSFGTVVTVNYGDNVNVPCEDVSEGGSGFNLVNVVEGPAAPCSPPGFQEGSGGAERTARITDLSAKNASPEGEAHGQLTSRGYAVHDLIVAAVTAEDLGALRLLAQTVRGPYVKQLYGALLTLGDYASARTLLPSLVEWTGAEYVDVQRIHLDFLSNEAGYRLSDTDRGGLDYLANSGTAAMDTRIAAQGLLWLLTGELPGPLEDNRQPEGTDESMKSRFATSSSAEEVLLAPNPARKGQTTVQIPSSVRVDEGSELRLYTMDGQLLTTQQLSSTTTVLELGSRPLGIYLVEVITHTGAAPKLLRLVNQ